MIVARHYLSFPDEDYDFSTNVNPKGTYDTCKFAVPHFKKQKSGSIISLATVPAHIGQQNRSNYCSTKARGLGHWRVLPVDKIPCIVHDNSVSLGSTDTPMLQDDCLVDAQERGVPYKTLIKELDQERAIPLLAGPIEIASCILFLATDDSSCMAGPDLRVDGGWTAK
ncbi:MAG: SDR family NAD(P)-dependent oxidoreductase [Candidatus Sigynarchaeota archaeon]